MRAIVAVIFQRSILVTVTSFILFCLRAKYSYASQSLEEGTKEVVPDVPWVCLNWESIENTTQFSSEVRGIALDSGKSARAHSLTGNDLISNLHKCKCHEYTAECLVKGIESMVPYLEKGIPELLMPSFEPYRSDTSYRLIFRGIHTLTLADIRLRGLTNFTIHNAEFTGYPRRLKFQGHFPQINISATGYTNVTSITDPITGNGNVIELEFRDIIFEIQVDGRSYNRITDEEEAEYFYVYGVSVNWTIRNMSAPKNYFNIDPNILASDKMLNNQLSPECMWDAVLNLPGIIQSTANNLFARLPIKTLCVN